MTCFTFQGARVLLPDGPADTTVTIDGTQIVEIGGPVRGEVIHADGLMLAAALVDVHGDAFERQLMPRPGVFFPMETAVLETDRQLAANGIATAYHAVTLSYEPGLRSVERGRQMIRALQDLAPRLTVENRVQLRWETFATEAIETLRWAMSGPLTPSLAFNDHMTMSMRSLETPVQDRLFEHNPDYALVDLDDPRLPERRHAAHAKRADMSLDDYMGLIRTVWDRRPGVVADIEAVAALARDHGVPMLSHDDTQIETRAFFRRIGATVAEFPMTLPPARDARAGGDRIIFGAPNVVRGGSHIGSLAAADMVEDGLCDALASDYFYPAMLAAIGRMDADRRADRATLWNLVSDGPAQAMGLTDRGQVATGMRADLVLVDWPEGASPAVQGTWVAGRCAYRARPAG